MDNQTEIQKKLDSLRNDAMQFEYEIAKLKSELLKRNLEIAKTSERRMKAITEESKLPQKNTTSIQKNNATKTANTLKKIEKETQKLELEVLKRTQQLSLTREKLNKLLKSNEIISESEERSRLHELTKKSKVSDFEKIEKSHNTYSYTPKEGALHIITGVNGTGKSRYLRILVDYYLKNPFYQKIICLSGTMYEKFPNRNATSNKTPGSIACEYLYFGNKSINNVFSERRPFRTLINAMLSSGYNGIQGSLAGDLFEQIGFERTIIFEFSQKTREISRNIRKNTETALFLDLSETLQVDAQSQGISEQLRDGYISLSNIIFRKPNQSISLSELSSGERLYLLAIMSLCFCVSERTLVLFDEPENSLHPQWQAKIIQDVVSIHEKLTKKCTVVVATHSPLIVSSAPNRDSYIRDLPSNEPWMKSELFGQNSDSVLADQFGVVSARSIKATQLIQECLTSMIYVETNPRRFIQAVDELKSTNLVAQDGDPLKTALTKIFEIRERYT